LGLLFGLGAEKFSHYAKKGYGVDVSHEEAKSNIKQFRKIYSGHRRWQLDQATRSGQTLEAITVAGKRRKLAPDNYYGACLNHPVQGTAAEIVLQALSKLHSYCLGTDIKLVNCVHDEILVECDPYIAQDVSQLMTVCMTEAYQESFPNGVTRGLVEVGIGDSWGSAKE